MKLFLFSIMLSLLPLAAQADNDSDSLSVKDSMTYLRDVHQKDNGVYLEDDSIERSRYDKRVHRYRKHWSALIPTQFIMQYAGNMGLISFGMGWDYGKHKQWETNLLIGFLPQYNSSRSKMTMTLKQNFIPWSLYLKKGWLWEPLSCGAYVNTVFGHEFWGREPRRYPDKYYPFLSTKARINVFVGQRMEKIVPQNRRKFIKSITFFYELSTCDLYIRAMIQDDEVKLWDILGLSLGFKLQLL